MSTTIKILLDSSTNALIIRKTCCTSNTKFLKIKRINGKLWQGPSHTTFVTEITLKLLELYHSTKCYLTDKLINYDFILGRDMLHKLGIIFNFKNKTIT